MIIKDNKKIINVYKSYDENESFAKKWSNINLGNKVIEQEKLKDSKSILDESNLKLFDKKILDVGCAGGSTIRLSLKLGAKEKNIHGIDIREDRVIKAKKSFINANISVMDARSTDYPDEYFDVIITFTLLSSILNTNYRIKISEEINRLLKPNGYILYYDFRYGNPFNSNVREVSYKEIEQLFPKMNKKLRLITLLPPLARTLKGPTIQLYPFLSKFSLLKTHYLGLFKKNSNP